MVAVDDVMGAHVLQVDALLLEELQGFIHILQTVDSHSALRRFGLQIANDERSLLVSSEQFLMPQS